MNKYKVEIVQTQKYVVDVLARNEDEARGAAEQKWSDIARMGVHHYHEDGDPTMDFGTIYDVTHTDDPFDASYECDHLRVVDGQCRDCGENGLKDN